jgi:DNA-binding MarR family transcriptional regulator
LILSDSNGGSESTRKILIIIPFVMRLVDAELRQHEQIQESSQFMLLKMVSYRPKTVSEIADRLHVSLPTVSKSVHKLKERGWVTLRRDEKDGRVVWIEPTEAGRALSEEVGSAVSQRIDMLVGSLSDTDRARLMDGLEVLEQLFRAEEIR